jgi:hypothetical protein
MMDDRRRAGQAAAPGLCEGCLHLQTVQSTKGSRFYLCRLSLTDPRFPRYPRIPVLSCSGFAPKEKGEG